MRKCKRKVFVDSGILEAKIFLLPPANEFFSYCEGCECLPTKRRIKNTAPESIIIRSNPGSYIKY